MAELKMTDLKPKKDIIDPAPMEQDDLEERIFQDMFWDLENAKRKNKKLKQKAKGSKRKKKKTSKENKELRKENQNLRLKLKKEKLKHNFDVDLMKARAEAECRMMAFAAAMQFPDARAKMIDQCTKSACKAIAENCRRGDEDA